MRDRGRRYPARGPRRRPPLWACGEQGCPAYRWQDVTAMGEYDPLDAAMADLEHHYRLHHPEMVEDEEEEVGDGAWLLVA